MEASGKTAARPVGGSAPARRLLRWGRSGGGRGGEGPADSSPERGDHGAGERASSLGGVARRAGRVLLWVFIGLVLIRGLGAILAGGREQAAAPGPSSAAAFPGDRERAFATGFARVYVESPAARALGPYLVPGLADQLGPGGGRSRARVAQAMPAGERALRSGRALITVACQLASETQRILYVVVPVARDAAGGLSVFGLPSLVASTPAGQVDAEAAQPVAGREAVAIRRLAERFLATYLSGSGGGDLAYLVPPGATIAPVEGGLRLVELTDVGQLDEASGSRRTLLAQARVRDPATRVTYPVAYRLEVVRRDRWYVSGVQGALR